MSFKCEYTIMVVRKKGKKRTCLFCVEQKYHFPGSTKLGKARQKLSSSEPFQTGQTYLLSTRFIAAASQHHEESNLIYGPLESILLDQGFPVEYELDAFNPPYTGTPLSCLQLFSTVTCNSAQTSNYFIPGQHFQETFTLLSHNNQDHTFLSDYIIPVLN